VQLIDRDFFARNVSHLAEGTTFDFVWEAGEWRGLRTNLIGEHQAHNAALALRAFQLYMERIGQPVDEQKARQALQKVWWPGDWKCCITGRWCS
jgi:folylpolyglutamate synthase/dihydropteroate synthase